jgi:hypothetical protein
VDEAAVWPHLRHERHPCFELFFCYDFAAMADYFIVTAGFITVVIFSIAG